MWLLHLFLAATVVVPNVLKAGKKPRSIEWQLGLGLALSGLTLFWIWNLINSVVQLHNRTKPLQASLGIFPFVYASLLIGIGWWGFVEIALRRN